MAERQINSVSHDDLPFPAVEYDAEADVLYISNGEVAPLGANMTQWVTVFYEDLEDAPNLAGAFQIVGASGVLKPFVDAVLQAREAEGEKAIAQKENTHAKSRERH